MEYEYRELSEERAREIDAKGFKDNLGKKIFINSMESVTNKDETVVFQQTWFSHEKDEPDEYLLFYKGYYYFIDMFLKEIKGEKLDGCDCWHYTYDVSRIYNTVSDVKDYPTEEILKTLKDVLYVKRYYGKRIRKPDEKVIIKLMYKEEEI